MSVYFSVRAVSVVLINNSPRTCQNQTLCIEPVKDTATCQRVLLPLNLSQCQCQLQVFKWQSLKFASPFRHSKNQFWNFVAKKQLFLLQATGYSPNAVFLNKNRENIVEKLKIFLKIFEEKLIVHAGWRVGKILEELYSHRRTKRGEEWDDVTSWSRDVPLDAILAVLVRCQGFSYVAETVLHYKSLKIENPPKQSGIFRTKVTALHAVCALAHLNIAGKCRLFGYLRLFGIHLTDWTVQMFCVSFQWYLMCYGGNSNYFDDFMVNIRGYVQETGPRGPIRPPSGANWRNRVGFSVQWRRLRRWAFCYHFSNFNSVAERRHFCLDGLPRFCSVSFHPRGPHFTANCFTLLILQHLTWMFVSN